MKYYSINKVSKILGVTTQTLRNWDKSGRLKPSHTSRNGYRFYSDEQLSEFTKQNEKKKKQIIGYVRVSSQKQIDDLERQKKYLIDYILSQKYSNYEIISDIGSGINYTKPGLKTLINKINNHEVDKVIVLYKDRLLRFGYELIQYFASINSCELVILDQINKTSEEELVEDLVQIITVFSCKLQGKRKKKTKELIGIFKKDDPNDKNI